MFAFLKKKSKVDRLNDRYKRLLREAHQLSTSNRRASDEKYAAAEAVLKEIEAHNA